MSKVARSDMPAPMTGQADEAGSDGIEVGRRLVRAGDHGLSLSERLAAQLRLLAWRSPLHRLKLRGRYPLKLQAVPVDPLSGDDAVGAALMAGRLTHRGESVDAAGYDFRAAPSAGFFAWAQSFAWLRDLAGAADRGVAARRAEPLLRRWLDNHAEFDAAGWAPGLIGRRILFWTAHAPIILSSADLVYRSAVLNSIARQARHLERAAARAPDGIERVAACSGLICAGLLLPGNEAWRARGEHGLERALSHMVLGDGGLASRTPVEGLELLELLLLARAPYQTLRRPVPDWLDDTIARMVPALNGVTLGDKGLGSWHGGAPVSAARIERATAASGVLGRPLRAGTEWGFHRLAGGRSVVVADMGPPPPTRLAAGGHASALAFEMSDGPERLIVNCGGGRGAARVVPADLCDLLRTSAAHSTLVLADVNSTQLRADGSLGRGIDEVVANRQENENGSWIDGTHDGYVRRFGLSHCRRLFLSADGIDLRGEDTLLPVGRGRRRGGAAPTFDIRFHLAPGVEAVPTADGLGALLKTAGGRAWRLRFRGATLGFDDSIWIDAEGAPRRTRQMVLSGPVEPGGTTIAWSFRKAG